jgi:HD-GYP domain-containing protein (c-di-GMP phosphodiesterase class II)
MSRIADALNLEESPIAQEHFATARKRGLQPLSSRERIVEVAAGGGMIAAAITLAAVAPAQRGLDALTAVLLTVALVVAARVRFDVAGSYTVASQVVFVPMLFLLPPSVVPLLVAVALPLAKLPEVVLGKRPIGRALMAPGDAWFALGPAFVLTVAGAPSASDASAAVLVAALAAQFTLDFAAAAARERVTHGPPMTDQLREAGCIYSIDALLTPIGFLAAVAAEHESWAPALLLPLLALLQLFAYERKWRISYLFELSRAYRGTATLLGDVVEADHAYTGDHSREVVDLALAVSEELALSPLEQRRTEFAALLHDIGKIAVPKEIIDKPGPLDDDEWEVMRLHTIEGEAMLAKVGGVLGETGLIVRASHEHYDGSGYPDGLRGDEIPIEARVVATCDAYSAMTTDRAYRSARSREAAMAEMRACAGSQFDPAVVVALDKVVRGEGRGEGEGRPRRFARAASAPELDERDVPA